MKCTISFSNEWKEVVIAGVGYGMVDALFNSMMKRFTKDFSSLSQIEFDDFAMHVKFKNLLATKTDAPVEIKIALKNKQDKEFIFLQKRGQWSLPLSARFARRLNT